MYILLILFSKVLVIKIVNIYNLFNIYKNICNS